MSITRSPTLTRRHAEENEDVFRNRNNSHISIGRVDTKGRTIFMTMQIGERYKKVQLNFNSPRTQYAAQMCGVLFDDCILPSKEEYFTKGATKELAQLRYDHQVKQIQNSLIQVYEERRNISNSFNQYRKQGSSSRLQPTYS